jgi:prephenate dehydrogenase
VTLVRHTAVIGLGLIGGSFARDMAALGATVSAFDADPSQLERAMQDGVVARALDASLTGVHDADLVMIAVPVDNALDVLRTVARHVAPHALITDVGSTKGRIVALARELGLHDRFIGSHPMAGDHRSGWDASRAGLFVDAPIYLCPIRDCDRTLLGRTAALWRALGGVPMEMDAELHDEKLAWTSHLPHMIAVVLGLTLGAGGISRDDLGPGGRDMTRIAGSSPEMWTAISVDNAPAIDAALAVAERELAKLRSSLDRRDSAALRAQFTDARAWFYQRAGT